MAAGQSYGTSPGTWWSCANGNSANGKECFKQTRATSTQLEIASATPQVIPEDAPVHGGEKLETNCVNSKSVPVTKPKRNVALSKREQGGENVTARYTRSGRLSKKPNRLDL